MDLETIISIAFVAVIILFQVFGALAGRLLNRRKAEGAKPPAGGGRLKGLVERVRTELQETVRAAGEARREAPGSAGEKTTTPRLDAGQTTPPPFRGERSAERRPAAVADGQPTAARAETSAWSGAAEAAVQDEIARDAIGAKAGEKTGETALTGPAADFPDSAAGLRQAILWSEILAPPLALRRDWD